MAVKVSYKQGSKQTYLSLVQRSSSTLYWCTDTRELFKGDDLYSDGVRFARSFDALPAFAKAADGILYFCEDSGCGYVLSAARDAWVRVISGVDGDTIEVNAEGMMSVKAVPIAKVTGLADELKRIETLALNIPIATPEVAGIIKPGSEFIVASDGMLSVNAVPIAKVTGLEERLSAVEIAIVGGVRYRGAVDTFADLPTDAAQGDLYEVYADNSEWCFNGEKWFEYGKITEIDLSGYAEKDEVRAIAELVKFEVSSKPEGTLVRYGESEIRVMCPADTVWEKQTVGGAGDANMYYMGFKAYAPEGAESFKEGDHGAVNDEMFTFDGDFAGIDQYGRKYSICWLALAKYDPESDTWTYFGKTSTIDKYIGWTYVVEWYDKNGVKIADDSIRINLSNEGCHYHSTPYYMADIRSALAELETSSTWGDM